MTRVVGRLVVPVAVALAALGLALRAVPWWIALSFAGVVVAAVLVLRRRAGVGTVPAAAPPAAAAPAAPAAPPAPPRGARDAVVVIVSCAVALLLFEVAARFLHEPTPDGATAFQYHPTSIYAPRPNGRGSFSVRMGPDRATLHVPYQLSGQGLRERDLPPKSAGERRILLLGDSFAMGWGLEETQTISRRLEDRLRQAGHSVTVINGGVTGYGPFQSLELLLDRGFELEPDLVILQLFPANDVDNTLVRVGKHLRSYDRGWKTHLHEFRYRSNGLVRFERQLRRTSRGYGFLVSRTNRPGLLLDGLAAFRFFPRNPVPALPRSEDRPWWLETALRDEYAELEEGWRLLAEDVGSIRDACEQRGVEFAGFAIVGSQVVFGRHWNSAMSRVPDPSVYERGKEARVAREMFEAERVPTFDVVEALHGGDLGDVYFFYDGHLKPLGADLVAGRIGEWLAETGFIDSAVSAP